MGEWPSTSSEPHTSPWNHVELKYAGRFGLGAPCQMFVAHKGMGVSVRTAYSAPDLLTVIGQCKATHAEEMQQA